MLLEVESVHAGYGRVPAVVNASLSVAEGELLVVVGPNGAGKTTLAKCIAGFVSTTAGSVKFEGRRVTGLKPERLVREGVRLVLEGHRVFPELTVGDNLRLGRLGLGDQSQYSARLAEVHQLFPILVEKADQPARELSGGQQQLLALGQAFIGNPKLLICDEPSLGVAQRLIPDIMSSLRSKANDGVGVVVIEQVLAPALEIADRVLVMNRGAVVAHGKPSDFSRERLRSLFLGETEARG